MESTPLLTVFSTVYNVAEFLPRFFDCMSKQTFRDYILLIIDDGSGDDTLRICKAHAEKDRRIQVIHREHEGITATRNYAISLIGTPFAATADGDDIYGEDYLLHLVEAQKKYDADMAVSRVVYLNEALKRTRGQKARGELFIRRKDFPEMLPVLLDENRLDYLYAKLFRSSILKTTYVEEDVKMGSDTMLCSQYVSKAASIVLTDDEDTRYIKYTTRAVTSYHGRERYQRHCRINMAITKTFREAGFLTDAMQQALDKRILLAASWTLSYVSRDIQSVREAVIRTKDIYCSQMYQEAYYRQKENLGSFNFCTYDPQDASRHTDAEQRLIVSLTSSPARISGVSDVLETIFSQTRRADEVILWLAEEQFPDRMLPEKLQDFINGGRLTVRWCEGNLLSHQKYYYAFREFPDDLVITVDDDVLYPEKLIETLFRSYLTNPHAVSAAQADLIIPENGKLLPGRQWIHGFNRPSGPPSMLLFAIGRAGVLFPVHLFNQDMLNREAIMENCPGSADIWLKLMQAASGIPVTVAGPYAELAAVPGIQEEVVPDCNGHCFDDQLQRAAEWFGKQPGGVRVLSVLSESGGRQCTKAAIVEYYQEELRKKNEAIKKHRNAAAALKSEVRKKDKEIGSLKLSRGKLKKSVSFRIGRIITWPGRKARDLIRKTVR